MFFDEVVHQQRDVLRPLAERRHGDREDVQAVPQVGPEAARVHLIVEFPVGGRDQAHVGLQRHVAPDALELAVLNGAQQFGLEVEGQFANLVEEQRAVVGNLEAAPALRVGAGERPFLVAEQLALDERRRQRRAVQRDERAGPARARVVNRLRDETLADAGLALQQHGARGGRHLLHLRHDVAHHVARREQALDAALQLQLLPHVGVVGLEPVAQLPDLLEGAPQILLGPLSRGHVAVRAADAQVGAVLADDRRADMVDPPRLARRCANAEFQPDRHRRTRPRHGDAPSSPPGPRRR